MRERSQKRSPWPYAVVGSLLLLAAFDAVIVKLALETQTGVVETNPYQASLAYGEIVEAKHAARRAGLKLHLSTEGGLFSARVEGGGTESPAELRVRLIRPDNPELDREILLASKDGSFQTEIPPLKPGLWITESTLTQGGRTYRFDSKQVF